MAKCLIDSITCFYISYYLYDNNCDNNMGIIEKKTSTYVLYNSHLAIQQDKLFVLLTNNCNDRIDRHVGDINFHNPSRNSVDHT